MWNDKNNLEIIDNAFIDTKEVHPDYTFERMCGALRQFIVHYDDPRRADGFTKAKGARGNLNTLTKEDIYTELLKNVVKLKSYRDACGERQALAVSDYFSPDMHPLEQDEWLFHQIMYYPLEGIDDMMIRNENIMKSLIRSFVDSRYYSYDRDNIEDPLNLTEDEQACLDKVDGYYDNYRYRF